MEDYFIVIEHHSFALGACYSDLWSSHTIRRAIEWWTTGQQTHPTHRTYSSIYIYIYVYVFVDCTQLTDNLILKRCDCAPKIIYLNCGCPVVRSNRTATARRHSSFGKHHHRLIILLPTYSDEAHPSSRFNVDTFDRILNHKSNITKASSTNCIYYIYKSKEKILFFDEFLSQYIVSVDKSVCIF